MKQNRFNETDISQALDEISRLEHVESSDLYKEEIEHLRSRMESRYFKVAVVGEFSSGKSTFINAILKKDLLKHAKEVTTACITEIVNIPPQKNESGTVFFTNGEKRTLKNFDELAEFSTAMSSLDVSAEVERVELRLPFWDEGSGLTLVDTPGLNGMLDKHRELTMSEVQNAHACIYLLQLRGIADSDLDFIKKLVPYQSRFLFVLNFIDDLHPEEGKTETPESKVAEIRRILTDQIFGALGREYRFDVCGVSALKALAARDTAITRLYSRDTVDISEERRGELWGESRFDDFSKAAEEIFSQKVYQEIKSKGTGTALWGFLKQAKEDAEAWLGRTKELLEAKGDARQAALLSAQKERFEQSRGRKLSALDDFIDSEHAEIRKLFSEDIRKQYRELTEKITNEVSSEKDPDKFKSRIDQGYYGNRIQEEIYRIDQEQNSDIYNSLQNLLDNALLRVKESYDWKEERETSRPKFVIRDQEKEDVAVNPDLDGQKRQVESDLKKAEWEGRQAQDDARKAKSVLVEKISDMTQIEQQAIEEAGRTQDWLRRHGPRPSARTKYRTETRYEKRGGFWGGIADFFCGPKEVTRTVSYQDDSAGEQWDREAYAIKEESRRKKENLSRRKSELESEIRKLEGEKQENDERAKAIERKAARLRRKKEEIEENYQIWERKARGEMFRKRKAALQKSIEDYLGDRGIQANRIERLENTLKTNVAIIKDVAGKEFEAGYARQRENLKNMLNGKQEELDKPLKVWQNALDCYNKWLSKFTED